jgi:hypothetical protein
MSDTPPDHLCNDPRSKFYDEKILARGIGIRFNGAEKTTVEEYCVSEGWVRMAVPRALDRRGRPMTLKFKGEVVAYFLDAAATPPPETSPDDAANPPSPA